MTQTKQTQRVERVRKATKNNPYAELTEVYEIAGEADKFHALKVILEQEGGQILLKHYIESAVRGIDGLSQYQSLTHPELVALCALITTNLQSARALTRAADNLSMADEALEEALRE